MGGSALCLPRRRPTLFPASRWNRAPQTGFTKQRRDQPVSPSSRVVATFGIVGALIGAAQPAFAQKKEADLPDTIVLNDGNKRKAEVVREDPKEVVFKNAQGKEQ